jgi:hypothetical protein
VVRQAPSLEKPAASPHVVRQAPTLEIKTDSLRMVSQKNRAQNRGLRRPFAKRDGCLSLPIRSRVPGSLTGTSSKSLDGKRNLQSGNPQIDLKVTAAAGAQVREGAAAQGEEGHA